MPERKMDNVAQHVTSAPFILSIAPEEGSQQAFRPPRSGDLCPACQQAKLDYDGMLNLTCARCGYVAGGGCFT